MDPVANIRPQRELARELLGCFESRGPGVPIDYEAVAELAGPVLALDGPSPTSIRAARRSCERSGSLRMGGRRRICLLVYPLHVRTLRTTHPEAV